MLRPPSRLLGLVSVTALMIISSACGSGDEANPSTSPGSTRPPDTSSTSTTAPASTEGTSDPSTTGTAAPPREGGCTEGDGAVPDDAVSSEIVDVDGDGRADVGWVRDTSGGTTIGVSTAAGGGARIDYESASPIPRRMLVANVDETGPVEIIVSDGRGASLYAFDDCAIRPIRNPAGETYRFDLQNLRGNGTGVGCVELDEDRQLVGLQVDERTEDRVRWTRTIIELDGLTATNGASTSGTYALPAEDADAELLDQITCGELTMADDGIGRTP